MPCRDQLLLRVVGDVVHPVIQGGGILDAPQHEDIGGSLLAYLVDQFLHARRLIRQAGASQGAGAWVGAIAPALPGCAGIAVVIGERLVEQVEDDSIVAFVGFGYPIPEEQGVVAVRQWLQRGGGLLRAGSGGMQFQDGRDAIGDQQVNIVLNAVLVYLAPIGTLAHVEIEPAILVQRNAHDVDVPG